MSDIYLYHGARFYLGQVISSSALVDFEPGTYAIWDGLDPNPEKAPVALFPGDEQGWIQAWNLFSSWEPQSSPITPDYKIREEASSVGYLPGQDAQVGYAPQLGTWGAQPSGPWGAVSGSSGPVGVFHAHNKSKRRVLIVSQLAAFFLVVAAVGLVVTHGSSSQVGNKVLLAAYQQTTNQHTAHVDLSGSVGISASGSSALAFLSGFKMTLSGSFDVDFGNNSLSGSMNVGGSGGGLLSGSGSPSTSTINLIVDSATEYFQVPGQQLDPGKTWLSTSVPSTSNLQASLSSCSGLFSGAASASSSNPTGDISAFSDPTAVLNLLKSVSSSVTDLGQSQVGGVSATQYRAQLNQSSNTCSVQVKNVTDEMVASGTVSVWISSSGNIVQEAVNLTVGMTLSGAGLTSQGLSGKSASVGLTVAVTQDYSNLGEPVSINPPPAAQVETISQFQSSQAGSSGISAGSSGQFS